MTKECRGLWAVVPVKPLDRTKRRLMPLLSPAEREALARAMLEDVLLALACSPSLAGIVVITGDAEAAAIARAANASVLPDGEKAGTAAAVATAAHRLAAAQREGMLVVPSDVPLIAPLDIETVLAAHGAAPAVTLVPASTDGGTNALACSPPDAVPPCFGEDSFRRHRAAALARGIRPRVLELERLGRDIDRPGDLVAFLDNPSPTRTYDWLTRNGVAERLLRARQRAADLAVTGTGARR